MLTIVICVGSSCHVRGSDQVAETFERLIQERGLTDEVEIVGAFCMEHCSMGVSVRVGDHIYRGVRPEGAEVFFENEIMPRIAEESSV